MKRLLILSYRMAKGYGVDVVIHSFSMELKKYGFESHIACIDNDGFYKDLPIHVLAGDEKSVRCLVEALKPDLIIAHTSPFFEYLPALSKKYRCWAWEHGDPTPELFGAEASLRFEIKKYKKEIVYPSVEKVIAITEFIREDIGFPEAQIIYNSVDYVPDFGKKSQIQSLKRPLRIGALTRLGKGEALYKGREHYWALCEVLRKSNIDFVATFLGRGEEEDALVFKKAGFEVHLNVSDTEKWNYLRGLDVFISCSLWEGFNLPLIEAQALGTASLAFDTGAHPEVSPLVFSSLESMAFFTKKLLQDPKLLQYHSEAAYDFVRKRFSMRVSAGRFTEIFGALSGATDTARRKNVSVFIKLRLFWGRLSAHYRSYGFLLFSYKVFRKVMKLLAPKSR